MLNRSENEVLTRTDPGTPMGEVMRRYWMPALLTEEIPEPDCPPVRVRLLGEDLVAFRETLERWVRRPKTAQGLALRARMILGCAADRSNIKVAADLDVSDETVGNWRSRFLERRLDEPVGRAPQRPTASGY